MSGRLVLVMRPGDVGLRVVSVRPRRLVRVPRHWLVGDVSRLTFAIEVQLKRIPYAWECYIMLRRFRTPRVIAIKWAISILLHPTRLW